MLDASVRALPFRDARLVRTLGIVVHRQRTPSNVEQAMIDACLVAAR
jgi:hypothetical protein